MNRLGVFAFYDKEGIVDEYVYKLLDGIVPFLGRLIIVCNGKISDEGKSRFGLYAEDIVIRENVGYDAGAYKDCIIQLHETGELDVYDELLLFNNSFFGPFYPLESIFSKPNIEPDIDFWGITEHPGGVIGDDKYPISAHIQSYFLLVTKRLLYSEEFMQFWYELDYTRSHLETVKKFEVRFSTYFRERGFIGKSIYDVADIGIKLQEDCNPYTYYSYQLVKHLKMPFLKITSLFVEAEDCVNAIAAMNYLEQNGLYSKEYIVNYMQRVADQKPYFNYYKLDVFCQRYRKIYIYGAGKYGSRMERYLKHCGYDIKGFIVSQKSNEAKDVVTMKEINIDRETGIIVALGRENTKQVMKSLISRIEPEQLFVGKYEMIK